MLADDPLAVPGAGLKESFSEQIDRDGELDDAQWQAITCKDANSDDEKAPDKATNDYRGRSYVACTFPLLRQGSST
jgi:hypothetical protein